MPIILALGCLFTKSLHCSSEAKVEKDQEILNGFVLYIYPFLSYFLTEQSSSMPFSLREIVPMSLAMRNACLGIIELAHPDARFSINEDYRQALHRTGIRSMQTSEHESKKETRLWAFLFKVRYDTTTNNNEVFLKRAPPSVELGTLCTHACMHTHTHTHQHAHTHTHTCTPSTHHHLSQ